MKNLHQNCLFCQIVRGEIPARKIWEDTHHLAILTPYPNTPGFTVVITKEHCDSYIFSLPEKEIFGLINAAKIVAKLLDKKLTCKRTGLIAEGMGIDHAHVKLVPMHGIPDGDWQPINSNINQYSTEYLGYLSSHDGPLQSDEALDLVFHQIMR